VSFGVTADSGFLIGLERRKHTALALLAATVRLNMKRTVPVAVLTEWWRGTPEHRKILRAFKVEPMNERLAKAAGEAMGSVPGATVVDSIVMASAGFGGTSCTRPTPEI